MRRASLLATIASLAGVISGDAAPPDLTRPVASADVVFAERDGLLAVEAEHFFEQTRADKRAWHRVVAGQPPAVTPDGDPTHVGGASGGAYLEILPDTRRNHGHKLIRGENFSPQPGKMAILSYKVHFTTPGRYYVWVRAFSTGSEDNGLHVGLDGTWPDSGQRLQWCEGKQSWRWESRQRTQENHCGERYKIFLDVKGAGEHTIHFSMREDGFEFDKWLMTTDRDFARPNDIGPQSLVHAGKAPKEYPLVAVSDRFPAHWGDPPAIQTRDLVALPGGYGRGSSTLRNWIQQNLDKDAKREGAGPRLSRAPLVQPRQHDGDGSVTISGELKQWHKVTLSLRGPYAHEQDNDPNPFTDRSFSVRFQHESGTPNYLIPGYFAADGDAADTSADSGTVWRAHLSPDKAGTWNYKVSFTSGRHAALDPVPSAEPLAPWDGITGSFQVAATDKAGRDLRGEGRLTYVGRHYLQFSGSGRYFLKAGADAPETLLSYADFDGTVANKPGKVPLKTWKPHVRDWQAGDPTWRKGKGKGLIGAVNYLSGKGCNVFSFLTYNAGGDGDNVWPFVARKAKLNYDCSKLDQWGIVFDHATHRGMYLHFKMQETEMDDNRRGKNGKGPVPESFNNGKLGAERKLYCRELVARFAHQLALNWNLGEENTQSTEEQREMAQYLHDQDPYDHNIVVHTFPAQQDSVYEPLLGDGSVLTGCSLQNSHIRDTHSQTVKWCRKSAAAGRPWIVAFDESGSAAHGQPPDIGYEGFDGHDRSGKMIYTQHEVRRQTLWGVLMGGGAGVEYYFGYQFAQNDLICEDWRSRDQSWDYCRIALDFFRENDIPFHEMTNADQLVGNPNHDNTRYCFAKSDEIYLVYLPDGKTTELDLTGVSGSLGVQWFNPRTGGELSSGATASVAGGAAATIGPPPADPNEDWLAIIRRN